MPTYNIVVFGGDYAGPEVRYFSAMPCCARSWLLPKSTKLTGILQVTNEAVKVLKVVEKCSKDVKFNFQDHLLGGVSIYRWPPWHPFLLIAVIT